MNRLFSWGIIAWIVSAALLSETVGFGQEGAQVARVEEVESQREFEATIGPWLKTYCAGCHNEETRESGIRLDHLDGSLPEDTLRLWEGIRAEVVGNKMPPEDEPQPTSEERKSFVRWADRALHLAKSREVARNGSMRRLTVEQLDTTLKSLLGIDRNLTEALAPDGVSREGFTNQSKLMLMNPLQLEAYFQIAERGIETALVDEKEPPTIQFFRMDLGRGVNPAPSKESLILGANNHLLGNGDFYVTEPELKKPFPFRAFSMQKKFRFIEGYQGNDTVRGWRDFDGMHHAVFACMRGNEGYPKGKAYEVFPNGLALRPAIPSPEIFGESSTYGPQANFKLSLRELPERGKFQVRVTASKVADGLLVDSKLPTWAPKDPPEVAVDRTVTKEGVTWESLELEQAGVYRIDLLHRKPVKTAQGIDAKDLEQGLLGRWSMDGAGRNSAPKNGEGSGEASLVGGANWVESPFGQALSIRADGGALVGERDHGLLVSDGAFTVAAWIHPRELAQGGIVCLGGYGYTHGWVFDMPDGQGILRLETANGNRQHNGTVQSPPGTIRKDEWQHVCAVVQRGEKQARLYVNGYQVAEGTIGSADLGNPMAKLHIGRVENAQTFRGEIDEVALYKRALRPEEIEALVEPGRKYDKAPIGLMPPTEVTLNLGASGTGEQGGALVHPREGLRLSGVLKQSAFAIVRLERGKQSIEVETKGPIPIERVELRRLDQTPNQDGAKREDGSETKDPEIDDNKRAWLDAFLRFEARDPKVGVHVGLRRDCGSTLTQVGGAQVVSSGESRVFIFEGDIQNFPSPDVEPDNVNYLAGIREIGVRSEYTDGRDMPRLLIHRVEFEGPYYEQWPPESHRRIFIDRLVQESDPEYCKRVVRDFAARAFRRPVTEIEARELDRMWLEEYTSNGSVRESIVATLQAVLTLPQFLYVIERSEGPEAEPLDDWELASKLSYFLWNAPPDRETHGLSAMNRLRGELDREIDRLVQDPRSLRFADAFVSQWLGLDKFDVVEVDSKKFPHLTRDARKHLRKEPVYFFWHLLRENRPVSELIASDYVMANEVVANYYGLGDSIESGFEFTPLVHRKDLLGGVLSQAAMLSGLSDGREGNPVKRGAWFARKIISEPPDDPPPNVPKLEDLTQLSLREKLERHRNVRGCAQCHSGIDPWGLPFEQFDASGRVRGDRADGSSELPDGTKIRGFQELREYLLRDRQDQVAFSLAKHLAIYATGRSLTYNEMAWLRENIQQHRDSGYRICDIVRWIIHSDIFDKK